MEFCKFSSEFVISNTTAIDNTFINEFLPYANDTCVKVYLYGLYKCSSASSYDNTIDSFSNILNLSKEDIESAFLYWQDQGLVQVLNTDPIAVVFMPVKNAISFTKKFELEKYKQFNLELQEIFKGRMITKSEYNEYYEFIEFNHFEAEALLMIASYAQKIKGNKIGYHYILTIAKNWAAENIKTTEKVEERLQELEQTSSQIGEIFKIFNIKRLASIDEKELFNKWQKDYDYSYENLIEIAKMYKRNTRSGLNFMKFNSQLIKYFEMKLFSIEEIESYEKNKVCMMTSAKQICKNMGLFYENLEPVVENYVSKWYLMGYDMDTLSEISNYCFKNSIRTLDGMDIVINKFFKLGITSTSSLSEYISDIIKIDEEIKLILTNLSITRNVNKFDRDFYNIWKNNWNMDSTLINKAASFASGKAQPMQYINKILSTWYKSGITDITQTENFKFEDKTENTAVKKNNDSIKTRDYSKSDINALFDKLEEIDL